MLYDGVVYFGNCWENYLVISIVYILSIYVLSYCPRYMCVFPLVGYSTVK